MGYVVRGYSEQGVTGAVQRARRGIHVCSMHVSVQAGAVHACSGACCARCVCGLHAGGRCTACMGNRASTEQA